MRRTDDSRSADDFAQVDTCFSSEMEETEALSVVLRRKCRRRDESSVKKEAEAELEDEEAASLLCDDGRSSKRLPL